MRFSVFTPSHNLKNIDRPLNSLVNQTFKDFEWVILLNGDAASQDSKLKEDLAASKIKHTFVKDFQTDNKNIGYFKNKCCENSKGKILVELDHDDELTPDCLKEINKTFKKTNANFVYSDDFSVRIKEGKETYEAPFDKKYGWKIHHIEGKQYHPAFEPHPLTFSYIHYAPDHVRAWEKSFYMDIGGHDIELDVCDDFDLLCRTYIQGNCRRIPKPLYKFYFHDHNTSYGEKNEKIQNLTHELHDKYIQAIAMKWCEDNGLKKVDLCSANNKPDGFIGTDKRKLNDEDIVVDLDEPNWPFESGTVGLFRANDAIEHLKDPINTMKEIYRCLADYGWALIEVPSSEERGAFQDPTHVSFWNSNSFWYYTKKEMAHYIGSPVKFQLNRILNYYPTEWHAFHKILYTKAHLVKLPNDGFVPPAGREI